MTHIKGLRKKREVYFRILNSVHNGREKDRNAQLIIDMQGATTTITDPSNSSDVKKFTFDYSYWSHDGCKDDGTGYFGPDTSHPHGKKFADQVILKIMCFRMR